MKKIINLFCVFLVLFSSFPIISIAETNKYGIVRAEIGINVRDNAGTNYKVIGDGISNNQVVTIYEEVTSIDESDTCPSHVWYKIKYLQVESGVGYACSNFIEILDLEVDSEFEAAILTFPESYRENLRILHQIYPNAVFRAYNVGLDFNEVVDNESVEGKNLLWDSNNSRDGLKNMDTYDITTDKFKNNYPGGGKYWYAPSRDTVAYYIDPRNFLNETRIFMFESLSYNSMHHNKDGVESILKSSFMYNSYVDGGSKKFSDVIMNAGITYGISPYYIASRILQETGNTRSSLVLGTYPSYPAFNGYYNFYNYGATGNSIVYNGLNYAYKKGWNSEEKAIIGGASLIGSDYISVGQDTNYFQKWDVICKKKYSSKWNSCGYYINQYMQNIEAPYSEAYHTYNGYKNTFGDDMHNVGYVFTIPVYENMPESTSLPNSSSPINYLTRLVVNNNSVVNFDSNITDYTISIPLTMKSVKIEATSLKEGATITGVGEVEIKNDKQVIPITVTALNGSTRTYNITVHLNDDASMTLNDTLSNIKTGVITDNFVTGLTNVDLIKQSINQANSAANVEVKDKSGNIVTSGSVGTGYKLNIIVGEENKELDIVIFGDTNGDTEISILDLLRIQKQLLGSLNLSGGELKASDINKDGVLDILDLLLIRKHLLGSSIINQ